MNNKYYIFGNNIFGPFLYGYIYWLRKNIIDENVKKIFFFSRDGYLMKKAYDIFEVKNPLNIHEVYAYFSRNSLRRALLWKCNTYEDSLQYLSKQRFITFSELIAYYGLSIYDVNEFIINKRIKKDTNFLFDKLKTNEFIESFYSIYKKVIDKKSKEQFDLICRYLVQIDLNGKCAIVDIGWHGTMQYYLEKILKYARIDAEIVSYNVGVCPILPIEGESKGYLFDKSNLQLRKSVLCFLGVFEKLFQSLEGSSDGYLQKNNIVVPSLKHYEYENDKEIQKIIKAWQDGALNYISESVKEGLDVKDKTKTCSPLIKFGKTPTLEQTRLFSFMYNTDGEKNFFIPQKSLFAYKPKEFILALSNSPWKTGFMKAAFKLPLPYYWIYKMIRK